MLDEVFVEFLFQKWNYLVADFVAFYRDIGVGRILAPFFLVFGEVGFQFPIATAQKGSDKSDCPYRTCFLDAGKAFGTRCATNTHKEGFRHIIHVMPGGDCVEL